jgi:hypothetical protein
VAAPPPKQFVSDVMKILGVESDTEFARALGLTDYRAPQRVRRWRVAQNGPNYEGTMLMLEKAGMLKDVPTRASTPAATARAAGATLSETELAAALRDLAAAVDAQTARLDELQPREAEQVPTRSRKAAGQKKRTA